jgi:excisionase family DNA binding protein
MRSKTAGMTRAELLDLPVSVELYPTAARALGIGRTRAYEMARDGEFPIPVLRLGNSYRVTRADLLRVLGETEDRGGAPAA